MTEHSFAICAYKESPYLEECILSLLGQTVKSDMYIATSTPNGHISALAEKYGLEVYVNEGETGIAGDWNYALSRANSRYVTIAHQDDIYLPKYTETMLRCMKKYKNPIIFSSNYGEKRGDKTVTSNTLLNIKKVLRIPMRMFPGGIKARRLSLAFGDSICCPSVTYVTDIIKDNPFVAGMKANLDWQQWEKLSKLEGAFAYSNKVLMLHRIHEGSETSNVIGETGRSGEDYEMFSKFHGRFMTGVLTKFYSKSEKSNNL